MTMISSRWSQPITAAVMHFWKTRETQSDRQGRGSGVRDAGARSAVTGGAQMQGFVELVKNILTGAGIAPESVHTKRGIDLPGWFRPEKCWDVIVVHNGRLIASLELKSQVGPSFGNNFNNRTEEALGSSVDLWAAYREGAFKPSARPWLGYLMLLEDAPASTRPVRSQQSHYHVFPEFENSSYARRYEILLTKLLRERLYDSACLLLSDRVNGPNGRYSEPSTELSFTRFAESLTARAIAAIQST